MQTSSEQVQGGGAQPPLSQMKLSRAGELAKSGDFEAALVMLLQMEPTPAALDLRARIELQRGHYRDARDLWHEVLEQVPNHAGAKKGLRGVENAVLRGKLLRQLGLLGVLLAAAYGLFVALRPSAQPEEARVHVQQPAPLQPTAAAVPSVPRPAPVAAPAPPSLPEIALPEGVSMRREDGAHIYSFDGGLFGEEGQTFVPGGRDKVTALGRALAPYTASIQIELIGYVETLASVERRYRDSERALARANAVLGRLALTTRIPADDVRLQAVGGRLGPYSDQPGDPRNRTVDIRVSLRAQP